MGIQGGKAQINVTPMIDVLLVLLIIFMVIQPTDSVGLEVQVPQRSDDQGRPLPPQDIILTVLNDRRVRLGQSELELADLQENLHALLTMHTAGVAFLKAENDLSFTDVGHVIDIAKGAGWSRIALLPR